MRHVNTETLPTTTLGTAYSSARRSRLFNAEKMVQLMLSGNDKLQMITMFVEKVINMWNRQAELRQPVEAYCKVPS